MLFIRELGDKGFSKKRGRSEFANNDGVAAHGNGRGKEGWELGSLPCPSEDGERGGDDAHASQKRLPFTFTCPGALFHKAIVAI